MAFPTDTLYALAADAFRAEAVGRVFEIKGRAGDMPLPLLLGSIDELEQVSIDIPDLAWALASRFWPGPLTLVLKSSPEVPQIVTAGKRSIAVRMPDHNVPLALIRDLGRPITGTSANPSGGPDPVTADDVRRHLGTKIDYVIDGGPATAATPSTIVDLTGAKPGLVRQGAIPWESLCSAWTKRLEMS